MTAAEAIKQIERAFMPLLGWQSPETAPIDEWVLLADSGGFVTQAVYGEDEGNPRWRLAWGDYLHPNFKAVAWQPIPHHPTMDA